MEVTFRLSSLPSKAINLGNKKAYHQVSLFREDLLVHDNYRFEFVGAESEQKQRLQGQLKQLRESAVYVC